MGTQAITPPGEMPSRIAGGGPDGNPQAHAPDRPDLRESAMQVPSAMNSSMVISILFDASGCGEDPQPDAHVDFPLDALFFREGEGPQVWAGICDRGRLPNFWKPQRNANVRNAKRTANLHEHRGSANVRDPTHSRNVRSPKPSADLKYKERSAIVCNRRCSGNIILSKRP
jgi:hypothetical protein